MAYIFATLYSNQEIGQGGYWKRAFQLLIPVSALRILLLLFVFNQKYVFMKSIKKKTALALSKHLSLFKMKNSLLYNQQEEVSEPQSDLSVNSENTLREKMLEESDSEVEAPLK